jgi:hypothetical protein
MLARVYAFLTTSFLKDAPLKTTMTRYSAKWILAALMGTVPSGFWYLAVCPTRARLVEGASPTIRIAVQYGLYAVIVLLAGTLLLLLVKPAFHSIRFRLSFLPEPSFSGRLRMDQEASPIILINDSVFQRSILKKDMEKIERRFLQTARWVTIQDVRKTTSSKQGIRYSETNVSHVIQWEVQ